MAWADLVTVGPLVLAILVAAAVIITDIVLPGRRFPALAVALVGLGIVAILFVVTGQNPSVSFCGAYLVDQLTTFLVLICVSLVALTFLCAPEFLSQRTLQIAE